MKKITFLLLSVLVVLVSCNTTSTKQSKSIVVTDAFNRKVTIVSEPKRIISISPAITEIMFALGKQQLLIGRSDRCTYPEQVSSIPTIGSILEPNIETIASLKPDLIIASTHFKKEMVDKIEQLGIPIIVLKSQDSFEGAYEIIAKVGEIVQAQHQADSIIGTMKTDVSLIQEKTKAITSRPTVYYVIGFGKSGNFTAGGNTFISNMINIAGGKNIAEDVNGWSYSTEQLIEKDPDIIIIHKGDKEAFANTAIYKNLKAVKNNKIYEIDNLLFELTGPRLSLGLKTLFTILHPEVK
jgi:iron complex transport system substrate-binding protein